MRMSPFSFLLIMLSLVACATPPSPQQRALIAQDVRDALTVARPWIGDKWQPYADSLEPILQAFIAGEPVAPAVFTAVWAQEPILRQALLDGGRTADEADAIIAGLRIALRRLEFYLTPAEVPS